MFADISHERQQSLLRQRNLFALTSAGLAVALAVAISVVLMVIGYRAADPAAVRAWLSREATRGEGG